MFSLWHLFLINILVLFATGVCFSDYSVVAVFSLIGVFLGLGFLLVGAGLEYFALLYVAIYAGAIAVLLVFVIFLLGSGATGFQRVSKFQDLIFFSTLLLSNFVVLFGINLVRPVSDVDCGLMLFPNANLSIEVVGVALYLKNWYFVPIIGVLLLLSLVCLLVLVVRTPQIKVS